MSLTTAASTIYKSRYYSINKNLSYLKQHLILIQISRNGSVKMCDFGISGYLVDSVAKTIDAGCKPYMAVSLIFFISCFEKHHFYFLLFQQSSLKFIDNCTSGSAPSPCIEISLVGGVAV